MPVYLDNAATTYPKPKEVYDFMDKFNTTGVFNSGRGNYSQSSQSSNLVNDTKNKILNLFHCPENKYQMVFTPSDIIALNTVLRAIDYTKVENILIMTHESNVCGLITPIQAFAKLAKKYNCINVDDYSQIAGLLDLNIPESSIDYAIYAGRKTLYAPFGVAVVVMKKDNNLSHLYYGGTGKDSANHYMPLYGKSRYEAGSLNVLSIAGLNVFIGWINGIEIKNIREKE